MPYKEVADLFEPFRDKYYIRLRKNMFRGYLLKENWDPNPWISDYIERRELIVVRCHPLYSPVFSLDDVHNFSYFEVNTNPSPPLACQGIIYRAKEVWIVRQIDTTEPVSPEFEAGLLEKFSLEDPEGINVYETMRLIPDKEQDRIMNIALNSRNSTIRRLATKRIDPKLNADALIEVLRNEHSKGNSDFDQYSSAMHMLLNAGQDSKLAALLDEIPGLEWIHIAIDGLSFNKHETLIRRLASKGNKTASEKVNYYGRCACCHR